ncbi:DUF4229 domain-containing protein [Demequina activiva]|uniref:DUF4229 domain-containing protein n=1 Tax=Demequina activiva TaxID=1582364 RepID=A0A919Q482_9MICO|nr:DUF4229 domain-containing protein [Demequina activiva]GIG54917.1 hypothetical protein Dac01nite_16690 [Demequina activiva]
MKIFAYWAARTGIFFAVVAALWLVGWFDIIAVIAAFVVAWLISYLALPRLRREAQEQMATMLDRSGKARRAEDAEEDAEIGGEDSQSRR